MIKPNQPPTPHHSYRVLMQTTNPTAPPPLLGILREPRNNPILRLQIPNTLYNHRIVQLCIRLSIRRPIGRLRPHGRLSFRLGIGIRVRRREGKTGRCGRTRCRGTRRRGTGHRGTRHRRTRHRGTRHRGTGLPLWRRRPPIHVIMSVIPPLLVDLRVGPRLLDGIVHLGLLNRRRLAGDLGVGSGLLGEAVAHTGVCGFGAVGIDVAEGVP